VGEKKAVHRDAEAASLAFRSVKLHALLAGLLPVGRNAYPLSPKKGNKKRHSQEIRLLSPGMPLIGGRRLGLYDLHLVTYWKPSIAQDGAVGKLRSGRQSALMYGSGAVM
jgi:hypothetical protein